jgi:biotin carboxylase
MEKEKVFIIGGGKLQLDFIRIVKENNYETIVFDYNPDCEGAKISDKFYCISIDNKEAIYQIAKQENPIAIHTVATELGNITACYVGEKLGLNTNSYETALNTVDKDRMKRIFENHDIPTARVIRVYSQSELDNLEVSFPLVVKAADRSAGRGVSLVNNRAELIEAYKDAYKESNNKIVLIEEYLEGEQYSVELVSQNGTHHILGITREYFIDEKDFVESHYLFPSFNEQDIIRRLEGLIDKVLNVFEIKYGASHIEFRIDDNKNLKIIEIASRMGGMRDRLLSISKGIDYNQLILNSITKQSVQFNVDNHSYALAKSIFTDDDLSFYHKISKNNFNLIVDQPQKTIIDKVIRPKTLMDAQDIYFMQVQDVEIVKELLNIWEVNNRDME